MSEGLVLRCQSEGGIFGSRELVYYPIFPSDCHFRHISIAVIIESFAMVKLGPCPRKLYTHFEP